MSLSRFVHPSTDQYSIVYTEYSADGVNEFCIAEFNGLVVGKECSKTSRFFIIVNERIHNIKSSVIYANKTGQTRYDGFCFTQSECKTKIYEILAAYDNLLKIRERKSNNPKFTQSTEKIELRLTELNVII